MDAHAAVFIWTILGFFAVVTHGEAILGSLKGDRGLFAQCKVICGGAVVCALCYILLPPAVVAVLDLVPHSPVGV
jgi:hypothetical protein